MKTKNELIVKTSLVSIIKKISLSFIVGLLLTFIVPTVTQQSVFSVEVKAESARQSTKKIMKAIRKCDDKVLNKYILDKTNYEKDSYKQIKQLLPAMQSYIVKSNGKISYTIKSCKQKGNNATVKLKVRSVKSDAFVKDVSARVEKYVKEYENELDNIEIENLTNQDPMEVLATYMKKVFQIMDKAFKEAADAQTTSAFKNDTITIKLKKSGNKWVIKSLDNKLANIMIANLGDLNATAVPKSK